MKTRCRFGELRTAGLGSSRSFVPGLALLAFLALASGVLGCGAPRELPSDRKSPLAAPGMGSEIALPGSNGASGASAAFDGTNFWVAWSIRFTIYAARISPAGVVLDDPPIRVDVGASLRHTPEISCNPTQCLISWASDFSPAELRATRVSPQGVVLDPTSILVDSGGVWGGNGPVATDGQSFLLGYSGKFAGATNVYVARVDEHGAVQSHTVPLAPDSALRSLSFDGQNYFALVEDTVWHRGLTGVLIAPDGTRKTVTMPTCSPAGPGCYQTGWASCDGPTCLVQLRDNLGWNGEARFNTARWVRVDRSGTLLDPSGVPSVRRQPPWKRNDDLTLTELPEVWAFDGARYLLAWVDLRNRTQSGYDLYGSWLTTSLTEDAADFVLSAEPGDELKPRLVSNRAGRSLLVVPRGGEVHARLVISEVPTGCTVPLAALEQHLYSAWDLDFDGQCRAYATSLVSGTDATRVISPVAGEPAAQVHEGTANQNLGFAVPDPDASQRRVIATYSCCSRCACQAQNGLTALYTCAPSDPGCGCAGQARCPGYLDQPFLVTGYADTAVTYNGAEVTTPTGLAAGPAGTFFVGNFKPATCSTAPECDACDPDHPGVLCWPSRPNCCDSSALGRLAQFTPPTGGQEASWRVAKILPDQQIMGLAGGRDGSVMIGTYVAPTQGNLYHYFPSSGVLTAAASFRGTVFSITQDPRNGDWYLETHASPKLVRLSERGGRLPLPVILPSDPPEQGVLQFGPDGQLYRLVGRADRPSSVTVYDLR